MLERKGSIIMANQVKAYVCSNCGAALNLNKAAGNRVECSYCGTVNQLENMVKNNEILAKDNINSGVNLYASMSLRHKKVLDIIASEQASPLDVYQRATIVKEEHICVPMFLFMASGTGTYSYEIGYQRERQKIQGDSIVTERYTEWSPVSSAVSCSETYFVCGNKDLKGVVDQFPDLMTVSDLIDIEDLELPADVQMNKFNYPQATAFENDVKPRAEALLKANAENSIRNQNTRNGHISSNVRIDTVQRVYLTLYRITVQYGEKLMTVWLDYKGRYSRYDQTFVDPMRKSQIDAQNAVINSIKPKGKGLWIALIIVSVILILICLCLNGALKLLALLPVAGIVFPIIKMVNNNKDYNAKISAEREKLEEILKPFTMATRAFIEKQVALNGIYQSVTGDATAFDIKSYGDVND